MAENHKNKFYKQKEDYDEKYNIVGSPINSNFIPYDEHANNCLDIIDTDYNWFAWFLYLEVATMLVWSVTTQSRRAKCLISRWYVLCAVHT